jgi:15-cis-phytoene synthase
MVNDASTTVTDAGAAARAAERRLILSYAPMPRMRPALTALLDLDAALGDVLRHVSEPMIVQMRLTWWHEALSKLDHAPPPAQPVLRAIAADVAAAGVPGSAVAAMVEGWEALSDGDLADAETRRAFAEGRGGRLFALAARVAGGGEVEAAGQGWALADLARASSDAAVAAMAGEDARALLAPALARRWPRPLRALGALTHQAAMDMAAPLDRPAPAATPGRVARLAWHRLTGR